MDLLLAHLHEQINLKYLPVSWKPTLSNYITYKTDNGNLLMKAYSVNLTLFEIPQEVLFSKGLLMTMFYCRNTYLKYKSFDNLEKE